MHIELVMQACNYSNSEVKEGGSGVQGHPQLQLSLRLEETLNNQLINITFERSKRDQRLHCFPTSISFNVNA